MAEISTKLLVIGAGPGGYVCALTAARAGVEVTVIEAGPAGGTCLNIGCIPSKALIHAAGEAWAMREAAAGRLPGLSLAAGPQVDLAGVVDWKDGIVGRLRGGVAGLLKRAGVRVLEGRARFLDGKTVAVEGGPEDHRVRGEMIVIATGSVPVEIPDLHFRENVLSSTTALALREVPRRLAVVGGGYIGLELGTAFAKLGAQVTIVEGAAKILPRWDEALTKPVSARLKALGIEVLTRAEAAAFSQGRLTVHAEAGDRRIEADKVLVTVGRRPMLDGLGIEGLGLAMQGRALRTDDRCRTSMRGIFAIGDVTGEPMLAHRAMAQGEMVGAIAAGEDRVWDKRAIPEVCFTDPEVMSVGLNPEEARAAAGEVLVGEFPYAASGRAMTLERTEGFVRTVARADNRLLLGVQAAGAGVSELAGGAALALEMGARLDDLADTIHAHPTMGEAVQEAAMAALGGALHL